MAITLTVKEKLGVIGERKSNKMELRIVAWNNNPPKYDIRGWYFRGDEEWCTKGISLTEKEMQQSYEILSEIDFTDETERQFGSIPQGGKNEIVLQLTKYGYEIRIFSGNYSVKGVSLSKKEMENLRDILSGVFETPKKAPKNEPVKEEQDPDQEELPFRNESEDERVIKALSSIPVNDSNYPINKATADQLKEAIRRMEADTKGRHKTRITRCKAKLSQLESTSNAKKIVAEISAKETKPETTTDTKETPVNKQPEKKTPIIKFPKKDTMEIVKLKPTGENHKYEEAEAKLTKEREMFDGNPEHDYVIKGLLEACVSDQEFLDNVMRPEKSYLGAFMYFANKAKDGYATTVDVPGGKCCVMDANTALKYAIDYFNSEDQKKPETQPNEKKAAPKKVIKTKRSGWKKGGKRK